MGDNEIAVHSNGDRYCCNGTNLIPMSRNLNYMPRKSTPLKAQESCGGNHRVRDPGRIERKTENCSVIVHGQLVGNVLPTAFPPAFKDKEDEAVIATDGTVKYGRGGAAYSIHSTETPGTIRLVVPVDNTSRHLMSYRTELFGIIGALLLLQNLLQAEDRLWHKILTVLWCDNKAAVRRFNALQGAEHFSITNANHSDADVLHELRRLKAEIPIQVNTRWVKSHQHKCTTQEAQLNHIVDKLATTQHKQLGKWSSQSTSDMLPRTNAQLCLQVESFTGNID